MREMFVSSLFDLLESLGVTRREVVRQLGVDRTAASFWAHGRRPISKVYARPFGLIVDAAFAADEARGNPQERCIRDGLARWEQEMIDRSGTADRGLQSCGRHLGELAHREASKLTEEELGRYMVTLTVARRYLRLLASRRKIQLPGEEAPGLEFFRHDYTERPRHRFRTLYRWHGVELDDEAQTEAPERELGRQS
jgi:hypothetical protein